VDRNAEQDHDRRRSVEQRAGPERRQDAEGKAISSQSTAPPIVSARVTGSASRTILLTGRRDTYEWPSEPCATPLTHSAYWTKIGPENCWLRCRSNVPRVRCVFWFRGTT
jgi:hypothetical protein